MKMRTLLNPHSHPKPGRKQFHRSAGAIFLILAIIVAISWWGLLRGSHSGISPFMTEAWTRAWDFIEKLIGDGDAAYTQTSKWNDVFKEILETLSLSLISGVLAGVAALGLVPLTTNYGLSNYGHINYARSQKYLRYLIRLLFTLTRTIPEVVLALLFLLIVGPGTFGVVLALAIHNFGVLGRLFSGHLDANPPQAGERLASLGSTRVQQFLYGDLIIFTPQILTLWLNRFEVIIRSTVVLGFISSAGLGLHLRLALAGRRFTETALVLMAYLILTILVDIGAAGLRKLAK